MPKHPDSFIKKQYVWKKKQDDKVTCAKEDIELVHIEEQISEFAEEYRENTLRFKQFCVQNASVKKCGSSRKSCGRSIEN